MRIAIIDSGFVQIDAHNPLGKALGGSETWMIQISHVFAEYKDVQVDVFMNYQYDDPFPYSDKLCYFPLKHVFERLNKTTYDFVILNRVFDNKGVNYIKYIKENRIAKHVYLQVHDLSLHIRGKYISKDDILPEYYLYDPFVTFVTLNAWHKNNLRIQYPKLLDIMVAPNGIDKELFNFEKPKTKDNRILWSSAPDRGLDILIKDIYPLVKAKIPDFGIDIAGYIDYKEKLPENADIKILGRLDKQSLYKEQAKHKVWFYPCTFAETFCITAIENIKNGCKVVSPLTHGLGSILEPYTDKIRMQYNFHPEQYEYAVKEAADEIIAILLENKHYDTIYEAINTIIDERYNWLYSVDSYLDHFAKINTKSKKILFLTMNCNVPYFKALLAVVKDTWAKPILQKKYENCEWFAYTSCDKAHPVPMIDYSEHVVYVDCPDDINHTYEKTQKAYNMLVNAGVAFDYIVRTNTSVFVNVKKTIEKVNITPNEYIIGSQVGYYHCLKDGSRKFMWNIICGLFFGMSKEKFDIAMSATNNYDTIPAPDDVIISGRLYELLKNVICIAPNDNCKEVFLKYKGYQKNDNETYDVYKKCGVDTSFVDDPNCINDSVFVQVRPVYKELVMRVEKGHELEHFYELNEALS